MESKIRMREFLMKELDNKEHKVNYIMEKIEFYLESKDRLTRENVSRLLRNADL